MPAPAVYVLAIVGTVGAVLAFKEFVYEPHIAPAIDRWKHEYQAARRRREAAAHSSEGDLLMSQTDSRIAESSDTNNAPDGGDDSDDDRPLSELGKGFKGSTNKYMKGSLLVRRPERATPPSQNPADVELDDFVAREVSEWRNEDTGQVLRQRKNASEHAMDESIHAIPYTPLSPSRTHVVFDPSLPSTPGSGSRATSLPHSPLLPQSRPVEINTSSDVDVSHDERSSLSTTQDDSGYQIASPKSPALSSPASPPASPSPPINQTISPPPQVSPFQHTITQSAFLADATVTTPTFNVPPINRNNVSVSVHPLQESYTVPSLSQSYPQDLDYEHGLKLLSPPSSRSESPFSMANLSPELGPERMQGLRALSPFATTSSNLSTSNFSSAVSSPSPLRMGLGNESFDAVSPILEPQRMSQPVSPFPVVASPVPRSTSVTNSARSTAYLSFPEDSEDEAAIQTRPPPTLGASVTRVGANSPVNHPRPQVLRHQSQTSLMPSPHIHSLSGSRSLNNSRTGVYVSGPAQSSTQDHLLAPSQTTELGLGLYSTSTSTAPPRNIIESPSASASADPLGHGHGHGHLRGLGGMQPPPSDGELSDLDLMSDYAPSESDFGNESDSSWSMAGESAVESPRLNANASFVNVTRGGTVREARGGARQSGQR